MDDAVVNNGDVVVISLGGVVGLPSIPASFNNFKTSPKNVLRSSMKTSPKNVLRSSMKTSPKNVLRFSMKTSPKNVLRSSMMVAQAGLG
ncbi:hypothetical protein LINPERPRIM_LOCUS1581 [Linum perenne]